MNYSRLLENSPKGNSQEFADIDQVLLSIYPENQGSMWLLMRAKHASTTTKPLFG